MRRLRFFISFATFILCLAGSARAWTLNAQEQDIANRMTTTSGQHRAFMVADPILSQVARERATDLAKRKYFDHIDPDGHGANYLVRKAGYVLPDWYPRDGNNLESIAAGRASAGTTWGDWMGSPDHKRHLLGELDFYAAQTSYGIGYYADQGSPYRFYWVVITAPPMPVSATIAIVSPGEGASLPEGPVAVAGTAGGNRAVAAVQISVENADGSTAWQTVAGTQSWSASLNDLAPGANTLHARSIASDGAVLAEAARTFQSIVLRPLTVRVEGQGSVGEFSGATLRQVGQTYMITATPSAEWLFAGWSGSWGGAQASATFTMSAGFEATATFIPNPFLTRSGAYNGLIGDSTAEQDTRGLLRLKLDRLGQFSGRLFFAGKGCAVLGSFGLDGKAAVKFPRDGKTPLKLKLDLNAGGGQIGGTLKDGATTIGFVIAPSGTAPAGLAGRYTLIFPADRANAGPGIPKGDGFAAMIVDANGRATISGTLADGTDFSRGGWITDDGRISFYAPLYEGGGSLSGVLTFSDAPQSDLSGTLRWIKPQTFNTTLGSTGARYTPPDSGQPVLAVSSANPNAQIVFGAGNLAGEIIQPANLDSSNILSIAAPALPALAVKIKADSGIWKGSFTHPASGAITKFRGVILRKQNAGAGFFLGTDQSGYVNFAPTP